MHRMIRSRRAVAAAVGRGAGLRVARRGAVESVANHLEGDADSKAEMYEHRMKEKGTLINEIPGYVFQDPPEPFHRRRHHNYIDRMTFVAKGGDGGHGGIHWYRWFNNPSGGPAGGNGGNGGDVQGQCTHVYEGFTHLVTEGYVVFDPHNEKEAIGVCAGGMGTNGDRWGMGGNYGLPVVMPLPEGTVVIDADTGREVVEFSRIGEVFTFAKGGGGGRGNEEIASSVLTAPDYCELGHPGEQKTYTLELRAVADVAMIGPPNAGKSSLLGAVSRAAPEVGPSLGTTWRPNIGKIHADETTEFSMVDLPPLEKDAHTGTTKTSHDFLKHAKRSHALLYVIDVCNHEGGEWRGLKDGPEDKKRRGMVRPGGEVRPVDLKEALATLQNELEYYQEGLSHKAVAIAITKMDLIHDPYTKEETWKKVEELQTATNLPVFPVSAHTKKGCLDLMLYLAKMNAKEVRDQQDFEIERTKSMSASAEAFEDLRVAEVKQIQLQRMQDFHLARAVEQVLEDRIRGRDNYQAGQTQNIELAREKVYEANPDLSGYQGNPEPSGETVRLADAEREDTAPFVQLDDMEDEVNVHPEDWAGGGMEDLREDRRTERYYAADLFHPLNYEVTRKEAAELEVERAVEEGIHTYVAAETELKRKEYVEEQIGSAGSLPGIDVDELARRNRQRYENAQAAFEENTRIAPMESKPLPIAGAGAEDAAALLSASASVSDGAVVDAAAAAAAAAMPPPTRAAAAERLPPYTALQAEKAQGVQEQAEREGRAAPLRGPPLRPRLVSSQTGVPGFGAEVKHRFLDVAGGSPTPLDMEPTAPGGKQDADAAGDDDPSVTVYDTTVSDLHDGEFIDPKDRYHQYFPPEDTAAAAEEDAKKLPPRKIKRTEPKRPVTTVAGKDPVHGRTKAHTDEPLYEKPTLRNKAQQALAAAYADVGRDRAKGDASTLLMLGGKGFQHGRQKPMTPEEIAALRGSTDDLFRPGSSGPPTPGA